jgi:hypothetical protein
MGSDAETAPGQTFRLELRLSKRKGACISNDPAYPLAEQDVLQSLAREMRLALGISCTPFGSTDVAVE